MPYAPFPATCLRCGSTFETRRKSQRFCGHSCATKATHPKKVPTAHLVPRDAALLHTLYVEQDHSTVEIARMFGVAPLTVNRVLREVGVPIAPRSRSNSPRVKRRRALTNARRGARSDQEQQLFDALVACGHIPCLAHPVDRFNIDIAFPAHRLAIEVDGGNWHQSGPHRRKDARKEDYLGARGWRVLRFSTRRSDWIDRAVSTVHEALAS